MVAERRPWFRFSGHAGNKLADFCVPTWSCGTAATMWSNSVMPYRIGAVTQITIYAHAGPPFKCDRLRLRGSVMMCSSVANDFIYRYDDNFNGGDHYGFCGMNA